MNVLLDDVPVAEAGLVDCPHCDQTHRDDLWHWQWCWRCRAMVRTCINVTPRTVPSRALCARHQPRVKPVQIAFVGLA